ncbi:3-hydroxyacyl-CoA dehydrogenase [Streptomyces cacaoi]|uniref:3-hydroxybutyryl-CoA dehydrogenase n=1 Tax=Streptomyces cacaoi TaxID=1898 RepID=A0A4Y3QQG9_STRCI|nr:3-hydroxyacyl-CoA dehydrogenase [Streptomyces cacaoi]NNG85071.1 3-hydroxyacyl-CoA dehydrogenase [Streptomyces cacaoi]GEB47676.1 3-hydroxybutyryl-CoA dehydrogenase [Streptomyces cacaoi]
MRIRVVGAGTMGRGIAQWAVTAGHTVELADARSESVGEAVAFIERMLLRAVEKGRLTRAGADAALGRLVRLDSPYAPPTESAPELVIEAVVEELAVKAELFTGLERVLPAGTVFATNTSSLSVTSLGARLADPGRLAGLHFFNPVPLMKVVEVVPGAATLPETVPWLVSFVESCGHRAVTVADTPGFLVNHAGRGLVTEAFALLEQCVADHAAIDRIARDVLGLRMGPFELMDLTGLDVTASVMETVWRGFRHDDRLRPSALTANRVTAGLLGRKTRRGFYAYSDRPGTDGAPAPAPAELPEPAVEPGDARRPRTVVGDGPQAEAWRAALDAAAAGDGALHLVPTWGTTVAAAVADRGLPPERTVGVDPLALDTPRRVLAVTPATAPDAVRDAVAVLADGGHRVTVVRDTAGSVAQRLLASVVGVATGIAERGIAAPDDIDTAVTLGLGYPHGPLAWGDRLGTARLHTLAGNLYATTGDPRYRPTGWLTERARLGLSLLTPAAPLPQ